MTTTLVESFPDANTGSDESIRRAVEQINMLLIDAGLTDILDTEELTRLINSVETDLFFRSLIWCPTN